MRGVGVLVVLIGLIAWGVVVENRAEAKAKTFCEAVEPGTPFAALAATAASIGEDRLRLVRDDSVTVGFRGIPPFSRHLCEISSDDAGFAASRYIYVD